VGEWNPNFMENCYFFAFVPKIAADVFVLATHSSFSFVEAVMLMSIYAVGPLVDLCLLV
jgi:hypothetical protein